MKTNKRFYWKWGVLTSLILLFTGCSDDDPELASWELEVAELKSAVSRYSDIEAATSEGFFDASGFVPNMGHHYILPPRIDNIFSLKEPEILLYAPDANGNMEFVAVEYAVPVEDIDNPGVPPEGFSGDEDVWELNTNLKQWQLHVWIMKENPEGIFVAHNPAIGDGN
ncbi:hypothetical protein [Robiginitalea sp. IMCC43444]|uniref:hypothetical protein n=1 Tax=Robiginitalea sp. IMCC43444 TaxID=3459121 RepID=UPI004041846C